MTTTTNDGMDAEVVIVGAGPVGLIIALMLAKAGIKVVLCETYSEIIQSPRAMAYGPAAVVELERAGVAQECRDVGMEPSDYEFELRWITLDNKTVASLPSKLMPGPPPVLCGQHRVAEIILRRLNEYPHAKVLWNHKVVGIEQDEKKVTAICETSEGEKRISGQYLVGADGARSSVRKLIGCTFDGFTYDKMVVATNVYYPFRENGWAAGQFVIHPEHFAMVFYLMTGVVNNRSAKSNQMECIEYLTARMPHYPTKKPARTSITNTMPSSPVLNPSNTISKCFRLTNSINAARINSVSGESFSRVMPRMRVIHLEVWG